MPLSNITSINLSLQSQGAAFVAREIAKLAQPARRLYVFGGASNVFPYFSTFANALTYANSLTPSTTNPVSIVLLSNTNGTPVEISGASDWYALCLAGINVSSPYREIFSTTTLPTTLPKGMRVMYVDGNGVESLWVGNADGSAWPARGWKEFVFEVNSGSVGFASVSIDEVFGGSYPTLDGRFSNTRSFTSSIFSGRYDIIPISKDVGAVVTGVYGYMSLSRVESTTVFLTMTAFNDDGTVTRSLGRNAGFIIRVYS
jgi:hypothetical protein